MAKLRDRSIVIIPNNTMNTRWEHPVWLKNHRLRPRNFGIELTRIGLNVAAEKNSSRYISAPESSRIEYLIDYPEKLPDLLMTLTSKLSAELSVTPSPTIPICRTSMPVGDN